MENAFQELQFAFDRLAQAVETVSHESIEWNSARGRFLFEEVAADRPSPAIDVSAMDGYAVRIDDIGTDALPVAGTIAAGKPNQSLPIGHAMKVFTGAAVPSEADCVVRREDTEESLDQVRFLGTMRSPCVGENIRRTGENSSEGTTVLEIGTKLTPASMSAIASFGYPEFDVHRKVRIVILNTGDEIRGINEPVEDWQIRDSNGPCLEWLFNAEPFLEVVARIRIHDDLRSIETLLKQWIPEFDAIIVTGGVSMGDSDHVPSAIQNAGGTVVFHKIPIRPGKPMLGAVGPQGQLILGLPGNPVSVLVTGKRFALPLLRKMGGDRNWDQPMPSARLIESDNRTLPLVWYRLVRIISPGMAQLVETRGSGDIASLAQSDGFIEIPPNQSGEGPWPFFAW